MAENKPQVPVWEDTDSLLTSDDPQAAIASRGLMQAAPVIQPLVQQAGEATLNNLQNTNNLALAAANGDPLAQQQMAEQHSQMAIGSVGVEGGAIGRIQQKLGIQPGSIGYNDKVQAAKDLLIKAEEAFKKGILNQTDVQFATQHLKTAEKLSNRNKFAEGGAVGPAGAVMGLAKAALSPFDSGPMPSGFQDPNRQEPSLEHPLIDPIDFTGSAVAAKLAPSVTEAIISGVSSKEFQNIIQKAKELGHDSVILKNTFDPADHSNRVMQDIRVVFEPNQIRSKFAEFNPKKAKSGNIAAGLGAVGLGAAGAAQASDEQNFAKGGEAKASGMYAKVPKLPVSGLPVSAQEANELPLDSNNLSPTWDSTQSLATNSPNLGSADSAPTWNDTKDLQGTYGTGIEQGKAALEGLGQGILGPIAPLAETSLGVDPEAIRARAEANPLTHGASELVGLVGPALLTGGSSAAGKGILSGLAKYTQAGALESAGKLVSKLLPAGETLAGKIGNNAAKLAIENGLFEGSDEVSKMILHDPNQTAETAAAHIGLGALLGGALGVPVGATSHLIDQQLPKVKRFIENVTGRLKEHVENPDPVSSVTKELGDYVNKVESLHDDVFGPEGLKAQDINKALPQMNQKIATQAQDNYEEMRQVLDKMKEKPNSYPERLTDKLESDLNSFEQSLSKDNLTSSDVFEAQQGLKQTLQKYAKFDRHVTPVSPEYDFIQQSKNLANKLRTSLEDPQVWGKAGDRQAAINKAFSEYLPTLKDFNKKFTVELNGERVIDPSKINTYLNQLEQPNAEIKKSILRNFIDSTEKYKKVINDSHTNLGLESPVTDSPMNNVLATFDKKTTGAKIADFIAHKLAPQALGGSAGGALGSMIAGPTGGAVGALMGSHSLAPFFNKGLPLLVGMFIKKGNDPVAAKYAADLTMSAIKGDSAITTGIKNLFKQGSKEAIKDIDTSKLDKMLKKVQINPDLLLNQNKPSQYYMPDATSALNQTSAAASNYLNSLRPSEDKSLPFDSKPIPSATAKAKYENALKVAQNPLYVLDKIKQGSLTQDDIAVLGAVYPTLYNGMKTKLINETIDMKAKGMEIPYKTRIGMSMFLAQPLDSTMAPTSIQSTQVKTNTQNQEQNPQQSTGVKSSPALQKMSSIYRTPSQTRSERSQKE